MNSLKKLIRMSFALGALSLIGILSSTFALLEIYENNKLSFNLEWNIVKATALFMLMFIVISSITVMRLSKKKNCFF